jgi:hypothetical protein
MCGKRDGSGRKIPPHAEEFLESLRPAFEQSTSAKEYYIGMVDDGDWCVCWDGRRYVPCPCPENKMKQYIAGGVGFFAGAILAKLAMRR